MKTAESVFEKAKDKEVAFAVVPGESLGNSESDGQLSLFSEPASNDYLAVSICFQRRTFILSVQVMRFQAASSMKTKYSGSKVMDITGFKDQSAQI